MTNFMQPDTGAAPGDIVNGRYVLPHPESGKGHTWMRTTSFISTISDTYGLHKWEIREVIRGLALREDLYATACGTDASDTKGLNHLADAAADAAGAYTGRRVGSALHKFTERADRGLDHEAPARWAPKVDQYAQAIKEHCLTVVEPLVERTVVNLRYGCAGTFDRGLLTHNGQLVIGDLKTQKSIYSYCSIAMQLAMYAGADYMWNADKLAYEDMPAFNQDFALVMWLPAEGSGCEVHWVDLGKGRSRLELCAGVLEARKEGKRKNAVGGFRSAPGRVEVVEAYARRFAESSTREELCGLYAEAERFGFGCEELRVVAQKKYSDLESTVDSNSLSG